MSIELDLGLPEVAFPRCQRVESYHTQQQATLYCAAGGGHGSLMMVFVFSMNS